MKNFVRILRHPLIVNQYKPLVRALPEGATLEEAIEAAKEFSEEKQRAFSYFFLDGVQYRTLEGGIFEMDKSDRPVRKICSYDRKQFLG